MLSMTVIRLHASIFGRVGTRDKDSFMLKSTSISWSTEYIHETKPTIGLSEVHVLRSIDFDVYLSYFENM